MSITPDYFQQKEKMNICKRIFFHSCLFPYLHCTNLLIPIEISATALHHWLMLLDFTGFFFEPTVFTDVQDGTFLASEESFGPIMIISKFEDG